mmetsp:Transcript_4813/g.6604  ORF Transcript_4813/g.6604 Transcript_4813/m.6604 type:complete len:315 (+) Transcript_4813:75-1019(+)
MGGAIFKGSDSAEQTEEQKLRKALSQHFTEGGVKKLLIGGNWKANGTKEQVQDWISMLNEITEIPPNAEVVCAPTWLHLPSVLAGVTSGVQISSQNIAKHAGYGAFTGEITAQMLKEFGVSWCITGHSERRAMEGETSEIVAAKTKLAIDNGLKVIFCCGETLEEREAGKLNDVVLADQCMALKNALTLEDWASVVIAYEPVWAIGTGVTASPEQAQEVHAAIRAWLTENVNPDVSIGTRILYGGSVKAANAPELIQCNDIDGFLVGGASLKPEFKDIVLAAKDAPQVPVSVGGEQPAGEQATEQPGAEQPAAP